MVFPEHTHTAISSKERGYRAKVEGCPGCEDLAERCRENRKKWLALRMPVMEIPNVELEPSQVPRVVIDNVEYIPRSTVFPDAALKLLSDAYAIAWSNGHYDPPCEHEMTQGIMRDISEKLTQVNKLLHFKK